MGVNRRGTFARFFPVCWGLGLLLCGCAAVKPATRPAEYWIAARYDVEPRLSRTNSVQHSRALDLTGDLSQDDSAIRKDFKAIADWGFGGVVLHHVEDGDRRRLLELAHEAGLKAAVPDRRFDRFVVTGEMPPQCRDENELLRQTTDELIHHAAFHGYVVEGGRGPAAQERSRRLRAQLVLHGAPGISLGDHNDGPLAVIDARAVREGPPGTAIERLLAEYHVALAAGQTGGLIVDRFLRPPGDPPGLTLPDEPLLPGHSSSIAALIQRARCWGPRLLGLPANPLISATDSSSLSVTVLGRGSRRYVFVFNNSLERFVREEVRLPLSILDRPVLRSVEVLPSKDRGAGRVILAQRGQLILPVELRPGDAALFEIF